MNPTVRRSLCAGELVRIEKRALTDIPHLILQSWKACTQLLDGLLAAEIDSKTGQSSSFLTAAGC
jgi:hypothetical protein